jgi:hypothetical protein
MGSLSNSVRGNGQVPVKMEAKKADKVCLVIIRCFFVFLATWPTFMWSPQIVQADSWLQGQNVGQRVWIDTSRYETRQRWIDTSHWEKRGQNVWVSSGYSYWVDRSHEDTVIAWMMSDPPWGWPAWGNRWWYQYADQRCPYFYGGLECYANWTWGGHPHPGNEYCPGASWRSIWFPWHSYGYWAWQDTSHYEWRIVDVWIASGYWQTYQAWVVSGYWAEPLHGSVTISKTPPFVFTGWHWRTYDGQQHSPSDERSHLDLSVTGTFNKPIKSIREYVVVTRTTHRRDHDKIEITTTTYTTPASSITLDTIVEYSHAGTGRHYIILTATDGSTATLFCDIPINGYRTIGTNTANSDLSVSGFERSIQDTGTITF